MNDYTESYEVIDACDCGTPVDREEDCICEEECTMDECFTYGPCNTCESNDWDTDQ